MWLREAHYRRIDHAVAQWSNYLTYELRKMEKRIMGKLTDVANELDIALGDLGLDVEREIKQLADKVAELAAAGDNAAAAAEASAVADRLSASVAAVREVSAKLKADDPAAPAPVEPAPVEPTPEVPAPEAPQQ